MAGLTDTGKQKILEWAFGRVGAPTNLYLHLITDAVAPTKDTVDASGLTQASNHGTAPTVALGATDFDASGINVDTGYIQIADKAIAASGGDMTARYAILADNATYGSITYIVAYWDLGSNKTVSDGQSITLQDAEMDINET